MNHQTDSDFCPDCKLKSEAVSAGNVISINFIGRAFFGTSNRCPVCNSEERNLFWFFLFPVIPLGTWKVKKVGNGKILTRKLSRGSISDFDTHTEFTADQQRRWHKKLIIGFLIFFVLINVLIRLFK